MSRHTLSVLVEDKPGVLARVASLFSRRAVTIEATGKSDKLAALLRVLEPYGIKELVKSGMVAVGRGPRSISDRSMRPAERSA